MQQRRTAPPKYPKNVLTTGILHKCTDSAPAGMRDKLTDSPQSSVSSAPRPVEQCKRLARAARVRRLQQAQLPLPIVRQKVLAVGQQPCAERAEDDARGLQADGGKERAAASGGQGGSHLARRRRDAMARGTDTHREYLCTDVSRAARGCGEDCAEAGRIWPEAAARAPRLG